MPNYEFYAQMAQTRANRYEQQYQQAYTAAYRDLMTAYQDEVEVRSLLAKQLAADKKNNAILIKQLMSSDSDNFEKIIKAQSLQQRFLDSKISAASTTSKNIVQIADQTNDKYSIPAGAAKAVQQLIFEAQPGGLDKNEIVEKLKIAMIGLGDEQKEMLMATYGPDILGVSAKGAVAPFSSRDDLEKSVYVEIKTLETLQQEKEQEENLLIQKASIGVGALGRKQEAEVGKLLADLGLSAVSDRDGNLQIVASSLQPTTELTKEDLTITPPTEQDILVRAAEYYRPYGTEEFKAAMTERDMQAVKRQKTKAKAIEDKKVAEETAKQELLSRLPSWGGRALKVAGDAETLTGLSLKEINDKGQPEAFGVLMLRDAKYDLPSSISKIDAEFDDPLDRQRALSVLMADNLKKHRAKKATEVDLTQEIES